MEAQLDSWSQWWVAERSAAPSCVQSVVQCSSWARWVRSFRSRPVIRRITCMRSLAPEWCPESVRKWMQRYGRSGDGASVIRRHERVDTLRGGISVSLTKCKDQSDNPRGPFVSERHLRHAVRPKRSKMRSVVAVVWIRRGSTWTHLCPRVSCPLSASINVCVGWTCNYLGGPSATPAAVRREPRARCGGQLRDKRRN